MPRGDPPSQVIIGLDVGTTGVKAAAFAPGTPWRRVAIREYPLSNPAPGRFEQDPRSILAGAAEALRECATTLQGAEVLAVSVSAGMHGLMALDERMRALTPLVTWADARAADEVIALRADGRGEELHARSGVPLHPMTPLAKLVWFAEHEPALCERTSWWVGLKDLVVLWLTGTLVTEVSSATGTGLFDAATSTWSADSLGLCGVSSEQLPPVLPTTSTLALAATTAQEVALPAATPVVVGAADGPLANLGTGAFARGVAGLSLGTSGAVRMVVDQQREDLGGSLFCYPLTDAAWVVGGAVSNGGSVLRWAGRALTPDLAAPAGGGPYDAALLDLAAGVGPGSDGLVMVPHLLPERAPLWDPGLAGAYLGLRPHHTRAHLVRAAMEGVALQLRVVLDGLAAVEPVESIRATGGVFRSPLWREVVAASVGRPLHVVDDADGTALGAAALGLIAIGRAASFAEATSLLGVDPATPPPAVDVDPAAVETYEGARADLPRLVEHLGAVARAYEPIVRQDSR